MWSLRRVCSILCCDRDLREPNVKTIGIHMHGETPNGILRQRSQHVHDDLEPDTWVGRDAEANGRERTEILAEHPSNDPMGMEPGEVELEIIVHHIDASQKEEVQLEEQQELESESTQTDDSDELITTDDESSGNPPVNYNDPIPATNQIECQHCNKKKSFTEIVQCFDGHVFCAYCLTKYVKEAVFEQSSLLLGCMMLDCNAPYPREQLKQALPEKLFSSYAVRFLKDSLKSEEFECQCCFTGISFEKIVQCVEGHLFCVDCLTQYVEEAVFGQGRLLLECMLLNCNSAFPRNQLKQALPEKLFSSYEVRLLEESLNLADIQGLVRCSHCDYAAILPDEIDVFECLNPFCGKETCRHCQKPWEGHDDRPCEKVDKTETNLRTNYEEKLTLVKIRVCRKCKTAFTKLGGCNKMVCRCGISMCYLCRETDIDYNHFCSHRRDPDRPDICTECVLCSLWTEPKEDEELAMNELKSLANRERRNRGYKTEKVIGI